MLHQAVVTKLKNGIFVTAKVEEGEGSIIQIVVVDIGATTIKNYVNMIYPVSKKLLGWSYSSEHIEKDT